MLFSVFNFDNFSLDGSCKNLLLEIWRLGWNSTYERRWQLTIYYVYMTRKRRNGKIYKNCDVMLSHVMLETLANDQKNITTLNVSFCTLQISTSCPLYCNKTFWWICSRGLHNWTDWIENYLAIPWCQSFCWKTMSELRLENVELIS